MLFTITSTSLDTISVSRIYDVITGKQTKCYKGTSGDDGTLVKVCLHITFSQTSLRNYLLPHYANQKNASALQGPLNFSVFVWLHVALLIVEVGLT